MLSADTYEIRLATEEDVRALRRLGEVDSQPPLAGRALIGEIDGTPMAALSLDDGRVTANPFRHTEELVACMQMLAQVLRARYRADRVIASVTA
jgi:hypothetical protein